MKISRQELIELFKDLRVADVRDGMDWMGYHHYGTVDHRVRPLFPAHAVGIARTAKVRPSLVRNFRPVQRVAKYETEKRKTA